MDKSRKNYSGLAALTCLPDNARIKILKKNQSWRHPFSGEVHITGKDSLNGNEYVGPRFEAKSENQKNVTVARGGVMDAELSFTGTDNYLR